MPTRRFSLLCACVAGALVLLLPLAGCQTDADSAIDSLQETTDRAQAWLDRNRGLARDIEAMARSYEQGNTEEAAHALDRIRERVNWSEGLLANDSLRTTLLESGTRVYDALNQPEKAEALLESALPHLDGPARERWQTALATYRTLQESPSDERAN